MTDAEQDLVGRVRAICGALPDVTERPSHGAPTWYVRGQKSFATLWADGHHGDHFPHLWFASTIEAQEVLIEADAERFFRPPYVGGRGWVGMRLDGAVDWDIVAETCSDAYRSVTAERPRTP